MSDKGPASGPFTPSPAALAASKDEQFTVDEILSVFDAPLNELQLWALIAQGASGLRDRTRGKTTQLGDLSRISITPHTLTVCGDGRVRILSAPRGAPAENEDGIFQTAPLPTDGLASRDDYEKAFVYNLAATAYHAADFNMGEDEEPNLSPEMEGLLQGMVEDVSEDRMALDDVLNVVSEQGQVTGTDYAIVCRDLVAEVYYMNTVAKVWVNGGVGSDDPIKIEEMKMARWKELSAEIKGGVSLKKAEENGYEPKPLPSIPMPLGEAVLREIRARPKLRDPSARPLKPLVKELSLRDRLMADLKQKPQLRPVKVDPPPDTKTKDAPPDAAGSSKQRLAAVGITLDLFSSPTLPTHRSEQSDAFTENTDTTLARLANASVRPKQRSMRTESPGGSPKTWAREIKRSASANQLQYGQSTRQPLALFEYVAEESIGAGQHLNMLSPRAASPVGLQFGAPDHHHPTGEHSAPSTGFSARKARSVTRTALVPPEASKSADSGLDVPLEEPPQPSRSPLQRANTVRLLGSRRGTDENLKLARAECNLSNQLDLTSVQSSSSLRTASMSPVASRLSAHHSTSALPLHPSDCDASLGGGLGRMGERKDPRQTFSRGMTPLAECVREGVRATSHGSLSPTPLKRAPSHAGDVLRLQNNVEMSLEDARTVVQKYSQEQLHELSRVSPKLFKEVCARTICYVCHEGFGWFFGKANTCYLCLFKACSKCVCQQQAGTSTQNICKSCTDYLLNNTAALPPQD
eukprot:comp23269_c0_seq1/m.38076 comp23269_c0_seq1/g.38076  ORF comp23269_c0_seq1/g.38076 comp23269_c0_seq1/m.38076 type:complete len:750 (-) comp23269_c0_seq1:494-2743(-)